MHLINKQHKLVDPVQWIQQWIANEAAGNYRHPVIYLAHPVAARAGETLATCTACKAEATYTLSEPIDLRHVCLHDDPVHSTEDPAAIVGFNLRRAMRWWRWFEGSLTDAVFTVPWYVNVSANGEADPVKIERGLRDDCAIVQRCDAIMMCGSRISSGMAKEAAAARECNLPVFQVTGSRSEPSRVTNARETLWIEVPE